MDYKNIDDIAYFVLTIIKNTSYARNIKIQKIMYVYEQEVDKGFFRFGSDKFGPFSKDVVSVIEILLANKYIIDHGSTYLQTDIGDKMYTQLCNKELSIDTHYVEELSIIFKDIVSDRIIKYVYKEYKDHLDKSEIINNMEYRREDYEWINATKESIQAIKKNFEE